MEQRLGRQPTLSELAKVCALPQEDLLAALEAAQTPRPWTEETELAVTPAEAEAVVDRAALSQALSDCRSGKDKLCSTASLNIKRSRK